MTDLAEKLSIWGTPIYKSDQEDSLHWGSGSKTGSLHQNILSLAENESAWRLIIFDSHKTTMVTSMVG